MKKRLLIVLLIPAMLWINCPNASAQTPSAPKLYPFSFGTDGYTNVVKKHQEKLYIGGSFGHVGKVAKGFAIYNQNNKLTSTDYTFSTSGSIAIAYKNGFLINPSNVSELFHLDSFGRRIPTKQNFCFFNGGIQSALWYQGKLIVAGSFSHIGNRSGAYGVVHENSGKPVSTKMPDVNGVVRCMESDGRGGWFIGGSFNTVNEASRINFAYVNQYHEIDELDLPTNGQIDCILRRDSLLFVSGVFTSFGDSARNAIAIYDLRNRRILPFNSGRHAFKMVVRDSMLYTGGSYSNLSMDGVTNIRAYNWVTGKEMPWKPQVGGHVYTLVLHDSLIYVGGSFPTAKGTSANLACISLKTGTFKKVFSSPDAVVYDLILRDSQLFVTGEFKNVGAIKANGICGINVYNNKLQAFYTGSHALKGRALHLHGDTIVMGGEMFQLDTVPLYNIAAFSISKNKLIPYGSVYNERITCFAEYKDKLAIGGYFSSNNGIAQKHIAMLDMDTGIIQSWSINTDNYITKLEEKNGLLYLLGEFTSINGKTRTRVAAIDIATRNVTDWNPKVDGSIFCIYPGENAVYLGGNFSWLNGSVRDNYFVSTDSATGNKNAMALPFQADAFSGIHAIRETDYHLYISGYFRLPAGLPAPMRHLVRLHKATGKIDTTWLPKPDNTVEKIYVHNNRITVLGSFNNIGSKLQPKIAHISITSARPDLFNPRPNGAVSHIAFNGNTVLFTGSFGMVEGSNRKNLARIDLRADTLDNWAPEPNSFVNDLGVADTSVFVVGAFNNIGFKATNFAAEISMYSGKATAFNAQIPTSTNFVDQVVVSDTSIYLRGSNALYGSTVRRNIAELNKKTGALTAWDAGHTAIGNTDHIAIYDSVLYASGWLSHGTKNYSAAAYSRKTGNLKFGLQIDKTAISSFAKMDSLLIMARKNPISLDSPTRPEFLYARVNNMQDLKTYPHQIYSLEKVVSVGNEFYGIGLMENITPGNQYQYSGRFQVFSPAKPIWLFSCKSNAGLRNIEVSDSTIFGYGGFTDVYGCFRNGIAEVGEQAFLSFVPRAFRYCAGDSFSVPVKSSGSFNQNNQFLIEIDSSRNFQTASSIGNLSSMDSGSVQGRIPGNMPPGNYFLRVRSTNPESISGSHLIRISGPLNLKIAESDTTFCSPGKPVTWHLQGNNYMSYQWLVDGVNHHEKTSLRTQFQTSGTHKILLLANGCNGTSSRDSAMVILDVANSPVFSTNDSTQCITNNAFQLRYEPDTSILGVKYFWNLNNSANVSADTIFKFTAARKYRQKLSYRTPSGCTDSFSGNLHVLSVPMALFDILDTSICHPNGPLIAANRSTNAYGSFNSIWTTPDTVLNSKDLLVIPPKTGVYPVKLLVFSEPGCSDSMTINAKVVTKKFLDTIFGPTKAGPLTTNGYYIDSTGLSGMHCTVQNGNIVSKNGAFHVNVQWGNTDTIGYITLFGTTPEDCNTDTITLAVQINANIGMQHQKPLPRIRVDFDPVTLELTIANFNKTSNPVYALYDLSGKLLRFGSVETKSSFNLQTYTPGIYYLQISSASGQRTYTLQSLH